MANVFSTNPVVLDTFSAAIDVASSIGQTGQPIPIEFIKWTPATAAGTCSILDGSAGTPIFEETCNVSYDSVVNYFHGEMVKNLYVTATGITGGKVFILLSRYKGD
jgi:hypothetical protein